MDKMVFSMYGPSCLIKAYGGPKKYRILSVGLLAAHVFIEGAIFRHSGLPAD